MYSSQVFVLLAINILLAIGCYLPLATGLLVVCAGSFAGIGASAAAMALDHGLPLGAAIVVAAVAGTCGAALVGALALRLDGFRFAIATLAIGEFMRVMAFNIPVFGGPLGLRTHAATDITQTLAVSFAVIVASVIWFESTRSRIRWSVVRDNPTVALTLGLPVGRIRFTAILACGAICGTAGALYFATVGILEPARFGFEWSLEILSFAFIGGPLGILGPVAGATLLTLLPEALRVAQEYRMIVYGAALVAVAVTRPDGIVPIRRVGLRFSWRGQAAENGHPRAR